MKESILVFGVSELQKSIIEQCKKKDLFVVGIDPLAEAMCRNLVDAFEVVGGQDFEKTVEVAEYYQVKGIITAATDKPLVMMARVAEKLQLPFFSVNTAEWSTDKLLMKQKFQEAGIPCARGFLLHSVEELTNLKVDYPVIVKPRDNSGSRGVIYCDNLKEVEIAVKEALQYTKKGNVLIEEFIEGQEHSIEGIHYNGEHHVIQFTEKTTTDFPYNVEIAHIQPADISLQQQNEIKKLITQIGQTLGFGNCASHTELKINSRGIYIIETSPRLGGDFISSTLVPLSTGINMEDILIDIATNNSLQHNWELRKLSKYSGIKYFELSDGVLYKINGLENLNKIPGIEQWYFGLKPGEKVNKITNSLERFGYAIFQTNSKQELANSFREVESICNERLVIY